MRRPRFFKTRRNGTKLLATISALGRLMRQQSGMARQALPIWQVAGSELLHLCDGITVLII